MKKLQAIALLSAILLSSSYVSADETTTNSREEAKAMKEEMMEKRKELRENVTEVKEQIRGNLESAKKSKEELMDLYSWVTPEEKQAIKDLMQKNKEELAELKELLKDGDLTAEEREEIRTQIENQVKSFNEDLLETVEWNEELTEYITEKMQVMEQNKELRNEIKEMRTSYREGRSEMVDMYKEKFFDRLAGSITKIPTEKLEKLVEQIDAYYKKVEENTKMSEENKEKMLSKLVSLQELIVEELEVRSISDDSLEME